RLVLRPRQEGLRHGPAVCKLASGPGADPRAEKPQQPRVQIRRGAEGQDGMDQRRVSAGPLCCHWSASAAPASDGELRVLSGRYCLPEKQASQLERRKNHPQTNENSWL